MPDDAEILRLLFARSENALSLLTQKYGAISRRIASNILKDGRDAEECVQDAYLAVWNAVPPARPDPLLAYVCRIVRNLAIKRYHANAARKRNSFYDAALDELSGCLAANEGTEDAAGVHALTQSIERFLDDLPQQERILFVHRYWYGDSVQAAAKRLGITANNASVRLSRLRGKLRAQLGKEGYTI